MKRGLQKKSYRVIFDSNLSIFQISASLSRENQRLRKVMSAEITSWWPRWSSNCLNDKSKFQEVSSFLKLRSNISYLFDVGHFTAHIYKQHFLDEPSKVMFVISRSYWSKLKIDFILIPSAFLSSPGEPYFFLSKHHLLQARKNAPVPKSPLWILSLYPQGQRCPALAAPALKRKGMLCPRLPNCY